MQCLFQMGLTMTAILIVVTLITEIADLAFIHSASREQTDDPLCAAPFSRRRLVVQAANYSAHPADTGTSDRGLCHKLPEIGMDCGSEHCTLC